MAKNDVSGLKISGILSSLAFHLDYGRKVVSIALGFSGVLSSFACRDFCKK